MSVSIDVWYDVWYGSNKSSPPLKTHPHTRNGKGALARCMARCGVASRSGESSACPCGVAPDGASRCARCRASVRVCLHITAQSTVACVCEYGLRRQRQAHTSCRFTKGASATPHKFDHSSASLSKSGPSPKSPNWFSRKRVTENAPITSGLRRRDPRKRLESISGLEKDYVSISWDGFFAGRRRGFEPKLRTRH